MSNIPKARELLLILMYRYEGTKTGEELTAIWDLLHREKAVRKAKRSSAKATKNLKTAIRLYAGENPKASLAEIAQTFSVNPGRVSEALKK